jgi:hypothetical protein
MTIKQQGGIFGRNPTFNNVTIDGTLSGPSSLSLSGNLVLASGQGIDFSATAGTGTSELFDDYEEGTWTPSLGGDATYLNQSGTYTKIGNQVSFFCYIRPNILGTGSTTTISGLPFNCLDAAVGASVGAWDFAPNNAISVNAQVVGTTIIVGAKATASNAYVGVAPFANSGMRIRIGGTYRTS